MKKPMNHTGTKYLLILDDLLLLINQYYYKLQNQLNYEPATLQLIAVSFSLHHCPAGL